MPDIHFAKTDKVLVQTPVYKPGSKKLQTPFSVHTVCMVSSVRVKLVDDNKLVSIVHTRQIRPLTAAMAATTTTSEASMEAGQQLDLATPLPSIKDRVLPRRTVDRVAREEIRSMENEREIKVSGAIWAL